jgi:hypothetical protein
MANYKTTTERGLGWTHVQTRKRLIARHIDGTPCPCLDLNDCGRSCPCRRAGHGLPMYRDPNLNPDGMPLEADHTQARARGGTRADRLLLMTCNRSRGDGTRGVAPQQQPAWWTRDWLGTGIRPEGAARQAGGAPKS